MVDALCDWRAQRIWCWHPGTTMPAESICSTVGKGGNEAARLHLYLADLLTCREMQGTSSSARIFRGTCHMQTPVDYRDGASGSKWRTDYTDSFVRVAVAVLSGQR